MSAASGAAAGAAAGSVVPGIGNVVGALGGAIIGGISSLFGQHSANKTNIEMQNAANRQNYQIMKETHAFNADQAQKQMDFQKMMSGTAYQRAHADMKAAGLNPMLAYSQGGASTPQGAAASGQGARMEAAEVKDSLGKGVATALDALRFSKELKAVDSQIGVNESLKKVQETQQRLNETNAKVAKANEEIARAELPGIKAKSEYEAKRARFDKDFVEIDGWNNRVNAGFSTLNNAKDLFMPKVKIDKKDTETFIDSKTGEILHESKRGYRYSRP